MQRSFHCSRTQHVVVDGKASEEVEITSGVPLGSVLGPRFFLLYKHNIAEYTKHSSVRLFADDTIVFITLTAENDCKKIQVGIQALERWEAEADWLMELYPDKYSVIRITRKKTIHRYLCTLHHHILAEETNTTSQDYNSKQCDVELLHWTAAKGNKRVAFH